jgi:uncharacterized integral membrane protein
MSTRWVRIVGGILIAVGLLCFAVTGSVYWLLCFLAGVGLILENWIKGGRG